jgi:hypothetical protein
MKTNKTTLVAVAVLLLAGIAAVVMLNDKDAPEGSSQAGSSASKAGKNGPLSAGEDDKSRPTEKSRVREVPKDQALVLKYGESRTNLSRHVSNNVISILDDAVQMGELMQSGQGGFGGAGGRGGLGMALGGLNRELALTEEQKEKASKIYEDYQKRQLGKTKDAVERLKKDPTSLMKLMLASDASARGEIQDDEYKNLQAESGKDLTGVINPLDRNNFGGGSPLKDEAFLSEFKSTLDPDQSRKLEESMAKKAEANPPPATGIDEGNISNMPKMELEKLDTTIQSAKKITTGIKSMMEGFGGLKDLAPPAAPGGN